MSVHRSLPQRDLPLVGAWCFLDRFGPQVTRMRVEPHPHIGLQTVTWPFVGDIRHRDSIGSDVVLSRGALNLMTSGAGIAHSEYSVGEGAVPLDALQLWVALPESRRHGAPAFERHEELPVARPARRCRDRRRRPPSCSASSAGVASPASVYTPIVGAEIVLPPGARVRGAAATRLGARDRRRRGRRRRHHRHRRDGCRSRRRPAAPALPRHGPRRRSRSSAPDGALIFLLGGEPFEDDIVMWWNFVGRSHEEIVEAREAWEAACGALRPRRRSRRRAGPGAAPPRRAADPSPAPRLTASPATATAEVQPLQPRTTNRRLPSSR